MVYKWCVVPECTNTSIKTPQKVFVSVPTNPERRRLWLRLARRDPKGILSHTNVFMCEDHFVMEKDMKNYYQYKMGFSKKIILNDGVVPTKYHCQQDHRKRTCDAATPRPAFAKRQRKTLIEQCDRDRYKVQSGSLRLKHAANLTITSCATVDTKQQQPQSVDCHSVVKTMHVCMDPSQPANMEIPSLPMTSSEISTPATCNGESMNTMFKVASVKCEAEDPLDPLLMEDVKPVLACCCCLAAERPLRPLEHALATLYEQLTGIPVSQSDIYPKFLCSYCRALLLKFSAFKKKCHSVQTRFQTLHSSGVRITSDLIEGIKGIPYPKLQKTEVKVIGMDSTVEPIKDEPPDDFQIITNQNNEPMPEDSADGIGTNSYYIHIDGTDNTLGIDNAANDSNEVADVPDSLTEKENKERRKGKYTKKSFTNSFGKVTSSQPCRWADDDLSDSSKDEGSILKVLQDASDVSMASDDETHDNDNSQAGMSTGTKQTTKNTLSDYETKPSKRHKKISLQNG